VHQDTLKSLENYLSIKRAWEKDGNLTKWDELYYCNYYCLDYGDDFVRIRKDDKRKQEQKQKRR